MDWKTGSPYGLPLSLFLVNVGTHAIFICIAEASFHCEYKVAPSRMQCIGESIRVKVLCIRTLVYIRTRLPFLSLLLLMLLAAGAGNEKEIRSKSDSYPSPL